ncbi:MAG: septum formation protein Maf [Bdellovibrionales bacterium]|nr:Maf family protein [Bdellovibrionales bacterium]NQZ17808.1 septum formation protein Maf [Bdellovibrionales bacterium]
MHELILASQSPRRRHILTERGFEFRCFPIEVSEIPDENLNVLDQISDLAHQKASAAVKELKLLESGDILVLSADTVVLFEGKIVGKPKNKEDAVQILTRMSGQEHQVVTGYCLWDLGPDRFILGREISTVRFRVLTKEEIIEYVDSGEPMDKAGSYGIQGQGGNFVEKYEGSFNNIVGLPIEKIEKVLQENGWLIKKQSGKS